MRALVLFRTAEGEREERELDACYRHGPLTVHQRGKIGELVAARDVEVVLCRYAALPFYKALEGEVVAAGAKMVNTHSMHRFAQEIDSWYTTLSDLTFPTYTRETTLRLDDRIRYPIVLKGGTNSRKQRWRTHMFAKDRAEALEVLERVANDGLFLTQGIYAREYVPLNIVGANKDSRMPPVAEEYRTFFLDDTIIGTGFYWSEANVDSKYLTTPPDVIEFARTVQQRVGGLCRFLAVDVARREDGDLVLVEIGDAQMAGLCTISPPKFYAALREALRELP